jgi:hypothetical protein
MLKEKNIIFTCSDCGVETYLTIKEKEKNYKDMVYVWFEISNIVEKMWVWIGQGDQKKGRGFINNQPHLLKDYLKLHDVVRYKTDEKGITRAIIRTN